MSTDDVPAELRDIWDKSSALYTQKFFDELDRKPLDCAFLDFYAKQLGPGQVLEVGCGPGEVGAYLHAKGVDMLCSDFSPGMVAQARLKCPGIRCDVADAFALPYSDSAFAGLVAFYMIVNHATDRLVALFAEWRRVLAPNGLLFLSFHTGKGERLRADNFMETGQGLDFVLHDPELVAGHLLNAGFGIAHSLIRQPNPEVESPTTRAYLWAKKISS